MAKVKERGIGKMIFDLRVKSEYTLNQLAKGVCSVSELSKFESDEIMLNFFQIDRLFSRLGKTPTKLEYVLSKEAYEIYKLRYYIEKNVATRSLNKARYYLNQYEAMKQAKEPLHRQFIEMQKAQIAWMEEKDFDEIIDLCEQAIHRTIFDTDILKNRFLLSSDELNLILFYWEISYEGGKGKATKDIKDILTYSEYHFVDHEELARVYPYAALLAAKYTSSIFSNDEIVLILRKAIELLRDEGKLFLLPEIVKEYEKYNNIITEKNDLTRFINVRKSLIEIGKIYQINYNKLRLFEQISRNFKLDYEIIRKNRIAEKMSQEKMSEEVCTRETLSRIERGVTCPTQKNLEKLLLKLNREGKRVDTEIITDFTVLEKKKKYSTYVYRLEYDKADLILEELKDDLDQTIKKNKQYILGEELRRKLRDGILSYEEAIILLYEILNLTVNVKNIFEYTLTSYEINLLNQIAIIYSKNGNINLGIEIYKEILRNLDESELEVIFRMQDWDLIMSNQASFLEINNQPQNAIELTQNRIKTSLEIGRGIDLGRALSTMACALEQENKTDCKYYFNWSADILFLMKNYKRYELIRKYLD